MKTLVCLLAAVLAYSASAATYECTDRHGRKTYTSTPQQNCRRAELGRISTYTPPVMSAESVQRYHSGSEGTATVEKESEQPVITAEIQAAEQRLSEARRQLEEGRLVRYGNERNYARYLERIKGLEDAVAAAEQHLEAAKNGGKP